MISNGAAEPAEDGNAQSFAAADTLRTLNHAGAVVGIDVTGAQLLRIGENAIYRLPDRIIGRIARTAAYEPDARKEVAVARWLEGHEYPAVRALPIDQPVVVDGRVVTFWDLVSDKESYGSTAEVASLLARLHRLEPPSSLGLPSLQPFARAELRIDGNGWLSSGDRDFLRGRLEELRTRFAELEFALAPGVIHGDASVGNVIHDDAGNPILIDLDGFAIGPREWDLVLTAIYYDSFGWHTRDEYEVFVKTYGFDVMEWPGYPVLRDVREFLMVTWLSQKASDDEKVAAEVRKRILALRTGSDKRDWQPY
ncbi:phosphotransferase enzyme family protein [Actinoallomurus rhizosphaericola]|uniref:phosphotransferase enzyme family protein n=1 Tax=Actinoallomurus rhizosphaericola TaxID=2952536 RepID=UPI0020901F1A|nr:aminoglycoside phosphotransferase family protein [Actinoallomurus rhizosphaericola]MCO5993007.1 aminoglycoside phosphotransferase family protein [Actinoallomurus rhizosphaericola]